MDCFCSFSDAFFACRSKPDSLNYCVVLVGDFYYAVHVCDFDKFYDEFKEVI